MLENKEYTGIVCNFKKNRHNFNLNGETRAKYRLSLGYVETNAKYKFSRNKGIDI